MGHPSRGSVYRSKKQKLLTFFSTINRTEIQLVYFGAAVLVVQILKYSVLIGKYSVLTSPTLLNVSPGPTSYCPNPSLMPPYHPTVQQLMGLKVAQKQASRTLSPVYSCPVCSNG